MDLPNHSQKFHSETFNRASASTRTRIRYGDQMKRSLYVLIFLLSWVALAGAQQRPIDKAFLDAVQKRDVAKINALLSKGANVNAHDDNNGYFALQYAINWPDASLVKLLLDK